MQTFCPGQVRAGFAACAVLILGGWVDAKQAVRHINWSLLLLIGSALGFSKAIANSGLADYAGEAVKTSGMSPSASLFVLFGVTMVSKNRKVACCAPETDPPLHKKPPLVKHG